MWCLTLVSGSQLVLCGSQAVFLPGVLPGKMKMSLEQELAPPPAGTTAHTWSVGIDARLHSDLRGLTPSAQRSTVLGGRSPRGQALSGCGDGPHSQPCRSTPQERRPVAVWPCGHVALVPELAEAWFMEAAVQEEPGTAHLELSSNRQDLRQASGRVTDIATLSPSCSCEVGSPSGGRPHQKASGFGRRGLVQGEAAAPATRWGLQAKLAHRAARRRPLFRATRVPVTAAQGCPGH